MNRCVCVCVCVLVCMYVCMCVWWILNRTNKQMAFARMEDVSAAVAVLVKFHGLQPFLGSRHTLQISFSDTKKMDIGRSASS